MTSYVENETQEQFDFDVETIIRTVAEEILCAEACPYEVQINVLLTDNAGIKEFNTQYRQIERETDVLSFPNIEFAFPADFGHVEEYYADYFDPDSGELILGDIILSVDKVREQARVFGHSMKREFAFLTAHSMLHLCGYDHVKEEETILMEEKQETVLEKLGITRDK